MPSGADIESQLAEALSTVPDAPGIAVIGLAELARQEWVGTRSASLALVAATTPSAWEIEALLAPLRSLPVQFPVRPGRDPRSLIWLPSDVASPTISAWRFALWQRPLAGPVAALPIPEFPRERMRDLIHDGQQRAAERGSPTERSRHVRKADGALDDLDRLLEIGILSVGLKLPLRSSTLDTLRNLARAGLFNAVELEGLLAAAERLLAIEAAVAQQPKQEGILPENPDRLAELAAQIGAEGPNEVLRTFATARDTVRQILAETIGRSSL